MTDTSNFIVDVFNAINSAIGSFVSVTYQHLVSQNSGVITSLSVLYIALIGYRTMLATERLSIEIATRHLVVLLGVYALIMNWDIYNTLLYNFFTNEPEKISSTILSATGQANSSGDSIIQSLNSLWNTGISITKELFAKSSFTAPQFYIYAIFAFLVTLALSLVALALFVYAKLGMAIMLALGVIFIVFYLFESTRWLTQSWIQQLINFALIPILTSAIIALMFSEIKNTLDALNVSDAQQGFANLAAYCLIGLLTVFLLLLVFSMASSLSGGITLRMFGSIKRKSRNNGDNDDSSDKSSGDE